MRDDIPRQDPVGSGAEAPGDVVEDARAVTAPSPAPEDDRPHPGDTAAPHGEAEPRTDEIPAVHRDTHRHRKPVGLILTVAFLSVLLIGVATLAAYLWHVTEAWEEQVEEITATSYELGDQVAAVQEDLGAAEQRIELLGDQLSSSKDTVSRLQAENAQWGDDAAYAQEQIALLQDAISEGIAVANSLTRCIEAHEQLVTYLDAPDDVDPVDPDELASYRQSVDDLCESATNANLEFQRSVTE